MIGRQVRTYQTLPVRMQQRFPQQYARGCAEAERSALKMLLGRKTVFPLLVTHDDRTVGLIKPDGNPTMLALETVPEQGIYAGSFYLADRVL